MTWADVKADTISVIQQKTSAKLKIALHPELRSTLDAASRAHIAIITTRAGGAYTVDSYSGFLRAAIAAAGLPLDCQPHGLRKAAGRRLAEAGCTAKEIMAVLGHKTLSEAERYTRDADQGSLSRAAMTKLREAET
jgi:integrase